MDANLEYKDYEFRSKNTIQKIWFLSAGVLMNFLLSTFIFSVFTFMNGLPEIIDKPIIKEIVEIVDETGEFSPAHILGIQPGDEVISINKINIDSWTKLSTIIHENPNQSLKIKWRHLNKFYEEDVITKSISTFKDGKFKEIGILGIRPDYDIININFFNSFLSGMNQTYSWLELMFSSLKALVTGEVSFSQMSGPLGIATIAGETAQNGGFSALIILMAIISVNLGIINILPIPGLDGGHVFIALIEGAIRRELPLKLKYGIQTFGFVLIMILFIFVFYNDIKNLL